LGNRVAITIKVNKILKSKNKVGENIRANALKYKVAQKPHPNPLQRRGSCPLIIVSKLIPKKSSFSINHFDFIRL